MTTMRHEVFYQDFPCTRMEFTRSTGLAPDKGYVEINMEDLGEIRLYPLSFRFRSTNTRGYESGLPLAAFLKIKLTATVRPPYQSRGSGLNEFGELVIQSYVDGNKSTTITYHDVYVDPSGLQEVTDDLSNVLDHSEGVVRVPLTDIRQFYSGHSPVYQRINARFPSGQHDTDSIYFEDMSVTITEEGRKTGKPYTAYQVFRYLFSQLPGSPDCKDVGGVGLKSLPDPQDIAGDGQPAVEVIQRLLDQYGLEACFQPDGNYILNHKIVAEDMGQKVPTAPGKLSDIPYINYERKTHSLSPRPPVVEVIGKKKVQQHRILFKAAVLDLDGVYRALDDIEDLWGYERGSIAKQIGVSSDKAFDDVPPGDEVRGADAKLYHQRREILRDQAYKVFVPAWLLSMDKIAPSYGGPSKFGFRPGNVEWLPTLPVMECPLYEKQMKGLPFMMPSPTGVPEAGKVVWVPPIVSGSYFTSGLFRDFEAVERRWMTLDAINQSMYDETKAGRSASVKWKNKFKTENQEWKKARDANKVWGSDLLTGVKDRVGAFFGFSDVEFRDRFAQDTAHIRQRSFAIIQKEIQEYDEELNTINKFKVEQDEDYKKFKTVYEKFGVMWLHYNVSNQIIRGGYAIDRKTGILKFNDHMYLTVSPFYFDRETVVPHRPAVIEMMYGVESNTNTKYDYTTIQVAGDTESGAVDVVGVQCLGVIPPYIMQAPSLQFAQEMDGTPMNVETVKDAALEMARPILSQPRSATGYDRDYNGLWKVVLDMGVSRIVHEFDGDVGYTRVDINNHSKNFKPKPGMVGQNVAAHLARTMGSGPYAK